MGQVWQVLSIAFHFEIGDSEGVVGPFPKIERRVLPTRAFLLSNSHTFPGRLIFLIVMELGLVN